MAYASPTDAYTNADVAAMIPEVWSPIVNEPLFPKAVLSNFFTDLSEYMSEGGDIVHVPDIYTNTFSVQTQSTQGAGIVDESVAQVDTTLTVNLHKYVAWIIGDLTMKQLAKKYSLNEKYAKEAQNLLVMALEDSLAALWSSLSTNSIGDTATVLSDAEIRDAIYALDNLNFDLTETAFFFHPFVYWTQLGGIAKYYTHQTSELGFIRSGNFGPGDASRGLRGVVYDQPIYVTNRIVSGLQTYRNLFAHPSAFGFAIQTTGGGRIRVQADYQLQNLGTLTVCDIIYGVAVLREPAACVVNANTTLKTS
jgi:hypothetical protein